MSITRLEELQKLARFDGDSVQADLDADALQSLASTYCPLSGAIIKSVYCQRPGCPGGSDRPVCPAYLELSYLGNTRRLLHSASNGRTDPERQFHL